jgi:phosphatidylserine/phosphatidylglycerophosphate/cardiolipin synthase-like enzyme
MSIYTLEHVEIAQKLAAAAQRGVRVRILLDGSPPGGVTLLQKWCVAQVAAAGGEVRYLAVQAGAPAGYRERYRYVHAKYGLIDGRLAFNGTENFGHEAMPTEAGRPVGGRRGYYLIIDALPVVQAFTTLFTADWAPERFLDLFLFDPAHERYGGPPPDFVLPAPPVFTTASSPFRASSTVVGFARFVVSSAPENILRPDAGIFALLARAGAGDEIFVEQLYEHKHWGDSDSNPIADPNPRLQAMIEAARRGAKVRLLLDSFFDEQEELRSNRATLDYVNAIAAAEGLDLEARLGNPAGGGIHAKLLLIRLGDEHWASVGSLNGGEVSHKLNREVVLLTDLVGVYERLAEVFLWDWDLAQ